MLYALVFVVPLLLALALGPLAGRWAERFGFMDYPGDPRRLHRSPTPRLGGVALLVPFLLAIALSLVLLPPGEATRPDALELQRLSGVILGSLFIFLVGLYDDRRELSPGPQLVAQILAAALALASGVLIAEVGNPFGENLRFPTWFAILFTLFWIVGMMNTVNWLDGLDGLAVGVTIIASAVLFVHSLRLGQVSVSLLPLALAGSALGFLRYNFYPARLFLGSSGAYFLGYALGTLSIVGGAKVATALLVLGLPILDVAWQILYRLRRGLSPFQADRRHLHHRLLDLGLSQRRVLLLFYLWSALFGALALLLPPGLYKLYTLAGVGVLGISLLLLAVRRTERG
ncbi:MAG: undecaprenyl/decaprenyl-phosphate alpha-N-acetylglucosaminyl 1-phosphate transferase [Chloroflexi bacterium]|nr:undecaprenyl/decaprenyl-phosphate alpha-N-acetylglucosaminyl 1-phosphate transferase [Chloroflexota bacterium]